MTSGTSTKIEGRNFLGRRSQETELKKKMKKSYKLYSESSYSEAWSREFDQLSLMKFSIMKILSGKKEWLKEFKYTPSPMRTPLSGTGVLIKKK